MNLDELLRQEETLLLDGFSHADAWQLGNQLQAQAAREQLPIAFEIYAYGQVLMSLAMAGTSADNADWIRRKRNTVLRFGHSSFYMGCYHRDKGRDFEAITHLDAHDYCGHGGSFPLRLRTGGLIGSVTVSGLPQEKDHALAVEALTRLIG